MNLFSNRNSKGALTLEATIVVPIFIFAVMSIAFFTRVIYIHNHVQTALNQTAVELSTYSYWYYISGLQGAHNQIKDTLNTTEKRAMTDFESTMSIYSSLQKDKEEAKKEVLSIISIFANKGFESSKNLILSEITKNRLSKYLNSKIFKPTNVGAYIVANSPAPLDSIDFSNSTLFIDNKTIDLIIVYNLKIKLPVDILPVYTFSQRATIKGFLDGDISSYNQANGDTIEKEALNYWETFSPTERGKIITSLENNKKKLSPDEAFEVRSINLYDATYKDSEAIYKTLKTSLDKFDKQQKNKNLTKKTFLIIVPEDSLTPLNKEALDTVTEYSKNKGIHIEIKMGYGNPNK